jgi:hypothetical protein
MPLNDEDKEAQDWLYKTDDVIIACRGQGHAWPKLPRTHSKKMKGVRLSRDYDGSVQIESTCRDCGMVRVLTTLPSGVLDLPAKYQYTQPEGYKAPKGIPISRRECMAESWRRAMENGVI